jgi:methylenetetrahydrofolate dehydrogenase (NADP+)/methenyltetrahydrofolate cyclohydrolase
MGEIINGKQIAIDLQQSIKKNIETLFPANKRPGLATILIGEDPASQIYVRNKHKACEDVGIASKGIVLPKDVPYEKVAKTITDFNKDPTIDGILLQLPIPQHLKARTNELIELIIPEKDVDCYTRINMGRLMAGEGLFAPCTPKGIVHMLKAVGETWEGKNVTIINRSIEVGRPLALLLIKENATVTVCHTRTKDINAHCRSADVIVVAVGHAKFLTKEMVKDGAIVIDVGMNRVEGKLVGDADFEAILPKVKFITPVPGGVGPMTVAMLMENTFLAAKQKRGK